MQYSLDERWQWGEQVVRGLSRRVREAFLGARSVDVDREVEQSFRDQVEARFPGDQVLGEELENLSEWAGEGWVIDPVDGTNNFLAGIPLFAVSVAYLVAGEPQLGWIIDPLRACLWSARRGAGAHRDGESLPLSPTEGARALAIVSSRWHRRFPELALQLGQRTKVRSLGSIAIEMTAVAEGSCVAGVWWRARLWDVAAASLILEEAGCRVAGADGAALVYDGRRADAADGRYTIAASQPSQQETWFGVLTDAQADAPGPFDSIDKPV